jgi:arginine-tRNA-protein transferase
VALRPARRTDENFALYRRYLEARHRDGGMDKADEAAFDAFLRCDWSPTLFMELRERERLLAVAVTDVVPDALSAVYTFFDPDETGRGLGTLAILQQIAHAQLQGRRFLYLGFWLAGHPKMAYKQRYRPLQQLQGEQWQAFGPTDAG